MVEITSNVPPGTPTWFDLAVPDLDRALAFYGDLFGWEFERGPAERHFYTICSLRGKAVAGIMRHPEGGSGGTRWTVYLATDDCDGTATRVTDAGGQVVVGPMDVAEQGRMAIAVDPSGAFLGLWQGRALPGSGIVNEPGAVEWNELVTPTAEPARAFYRSVLDLSAEPLPDGDIDFTTLHRPDGHIVGGIYGLPSAAGSSWLTYFHVPDTDDALERARAAGGTAPGAAWDSPYGRMGDVLDPFGTPFRVMTPAANPPS